MCMGIWCVVYAWLCVYVRMGVYVYERRSQLRASTAYGKRG